MIKTVLKSLALLFSVVITNHVDAGNPYYSVVRTRDYLMVMHQSTPVLGYRILPRSQDGKYARNNYVDLYNQQGYEITEDFPADHLHHRGVFWAWHQVLVGDQRLGDSWECRDFTWDSKEVTISRPRGGLQIKTLTHWSSSDYRDGQGIDIPIVLEETKILIHKSKKSIRMIDFHITINPLVDELKLGGSENDKGYGGFSPRIALPADIKFWSEQGEVTPQRTAIEAGPWINLEGTFHENDARPSAIAIICHQANPVYPDKWILRARGSMQNAAYPGQHAVAVPKENPLELRYRIVLQQNGHDPQRVSRWSKQF